MKTEARVLLRLARGEDLEEGPHVSNWDAIRQLAVSHQVDALLHQHVLDGSAAGRVLQDAPIAVRQSLRRAWLHEGLRNSHLASCLRDLAEVFAAEEVDFVVFKGPWLAFEAYPSPNCRSIEDIDLGIREEDYLATLRALGRLGYTPLDPLPKTGQRAAQQAHYSSQVRFVAPSRRPVEVHFRLVNLGPTSDQEPWLWEGRKELDLDGTTIFVPGNEAMLLHLLLHANQHGFRCLRLLYDVHFALERIHEQLDVGVVLELIRSRKCGTSCWFTLELCRSMTGTRHGREIADLLRPSWFERQRFEAVWSLDRVRGLEPVIRRSSAEAPRFYLLELDGFLTRLNYAFRVARQQLRLPT